MKFVESRAELCIVTLNPRICDSSGVYICNSIVNDLRHGNFICKSEERFPNLQNREQQLNDVLLEKCIYGQELQRKAFPVGLEIKCFKKKQEKKSDLK